MSSINYLSIAKTPNNLNYAIFKNKKLVSYGVYKLDFIGYEKNVLNIIESLIKQYKIDIVLTNDLLVDNYTKVELKTIVAFQTIVKVASIINGAMYSEFRTYGWKKRILFNRITPKQKIETINFGYELDLSYNDYGIADAIILGEGVAHNRLQIGSV